MNKKTLTVLIIISLLTVTLCGCGLSAKNAESIEITGYKQSFSLEEDFSTGEATVTAYYKNGKSAVLEKDYQINASQFQKGVAGEYTVTLSYGGVSSSYKVYVYPIAPLTYTLTTDGEAYSVSGIESTFDKTQNYIVSIPKTYNDKPVTGISAGAFRSNANLKNVEISNGITAIGSYAFLGCTGLSQIVFPDSVATLSSFSFSGCTNLTDVIFENTDTATAIGENVFQNTAWFSSQENGVVYAGKNVYAYKGTMPSNTSVVLENGTLGVSDYAFRNCLNLISVTLPSTLTAVGTNSFYGCYRLIEVCNLSSLEIKVGSTLNGYVGCYAENIYDESGESKLLEENDFLIYNGNVVVSYTGASTSISISNEITKINRYAFYGCNSLANIEIPDSVISIGASAFANTAWYASREDGVVYAGKVAYTYKGTATTNFVVTLDSGTLGIGDNAFYNCTRLVRITIPSSVKYIGNYAFYGCVGLTTVGIPEGVTEIGNSVFEVCTSLVDITIPNSVVRIGTYVFDDCTNLALVTFTDVSTWYWTTDYALWRSGSEGIVLELDDSSNNAVSLKNLFGGCYLYKK